MIPSDKLAHQARSALKILGSISIPSDGGDMGPTHTWDGLRIEDARMKDPGTLKQESSQPLMLDVPDLEDQDQSPIAEQMVQYYPTLR